MSYDVFLFGVYVGTTLAFYAKEACENFGGDNIFGYTACPSEATATE